MIKIYVCGPTVYDKAHLGNLKPILTFDLFVRALKAQQKEVYLVHNITDIDDKIINQAQKLHTSEREIAQKYLAYYQAMLTKYNINFPNAMPKVTTHIKGIVTFIEKLIIKKMAYEQNGNVFFNVKALKNYGEISGNDLTKLTSQSKIQKNENKKHIFDFALWKKTTIGQTFSSPWGYGRPGWHTECAFFIDHFFKKETLDIHGGGVDLIFPHHENENAQFYALHHKPIAHKFVHVGLFSFGGQKMAKSLGNTFDIEKFAHQYGPDTFRTLILSASVTAPLNLTAEVIANAQIITQRFHKVFKKAQLLCANNSIKKVDNKEIWKLLSTWKFSEAMKEVNLMIKNFNNNPSLIQANKLKKFFQQIGFIFAKQEILPSDLKLYNDWTKARLNHDFEIADKLRKRLQKRNLI